MKHPYAVVRFLNRYNKAMTFQDGTFQPFLDSYAQMLGCPDLLSWEAYSDQRLSAEDQQELKDHLESCPHCPQLLQVLATEKLSLPEISEHELPIHTPEPQPSLEKPAELALGQIWSTQAELCLSDYDLPAEGSPVVAGFLRLFVIVELQERVFGQARFQLLRLCPLTELQDLATAQDWLLSAADTPFDEPLMLELWNTQTALALHLEDYWGQLSETVLAQLPAVLAGQQAPPQHGGHPLDAQSLHLQFQQLESQQTAYLAQPVQALQRLQALSVPFMVQVTPQGLKPPQQLTSPSSLFPRRQSGSSSELQERLLAASSQAPVSDPPATAPSAWKELLQLDQALSLEIWLEGKNLEFYASEAEQPYAGLEIYYTDRQGQWQCLRSDSLGSAFLPVTALYAGHSLLTFVRQQEQQSPKRFLYPIYPIQTGADT